MQVRTSSQMSRESDPSRGPSQLVLSPSNMTGENGSVAPAVIDYSQVKSKQQRPDSSGLRKSHPNPTELTKQDSSYGNLVKTKAQHLAKNPNLVYIKRDSKNDQIAKANAQKQRGKHMTKKQSTCSTNAQQNMAPIGGRNMDIAHMKQSKEFQLPEPVISTNIISSTQQSKAGGPGLGSAKMPAESVNPLSVNQHAIIKGPNSIVMSKPLTVGVSTTKGRPTQYARFRLQEHIMALAQPKNVPICGPRLRELSNVVFEQKVAQQYSTSFTTTNRGASGAMDLVGNRRGSAASSQDPLQLTLNDNFRSPHHLAQQFQSYKVGERKTVAGGENNRPYFGHTPTVPQTYRPQSHYGRENMQQINTESIIQAESTIKNSTQRLHRPKSLRAVQVNVPQNAQQQQLTSLASRNTQLLPQEPSLGIRSDGNGVAGLIPSATQNPYVAAKDSNQQPIVRGMADSQSNMRRKRSSGVNLHQLRDNVGKVVNLNRRVMTARNNSHTTSVKTTSISQTPVLVQKLRGRKETLLLSGNELQISKTRIFDATQTVSRQTRIDANESLQLQKKFLSQQLLQKDDMKKRQESQPSPVKDGALSTVMKTQDEQAPANQARIQPSPLPYHLNSEGNSDFQASVERDTRSPTKNVTVFDKIATQTQEYQTEEGHQSQLSPVPTPSPFKKGEDQELGKQGLTAAESVNIACQNVQAIAPLQLLNQSQDLSPLSKKDENDAPDVISNLEPKLPNTHSSDATPTMNARLQPDFAQGNLMHQYTNRINLEQKLQDTLPDSARNTFKSNIADLKSLASADQLQPVNNTHSQSNGLSTVSPQVFSVDRIATTAIAQTGLSKSHLSKLKREARQAKVSQSRERSHSRSRHHEGRSCSRCNDQQAEATKWQIDKSFQNTSRSKVYFKPSVVEIQDESLSANTRNIAADSPTRSGRKAPNEKEIPKSYLLGPHISQEYPNLGSIKEETTTNGLRASMDSTYMQALFGGSGEEPNLGDIANNPETREFILYLQQVQPDLLMQQQQQINFDSSAAILRDAPTALLPPLRRLSSEALTPPVPEQSLALHLQAQTTLNVGAVAQQPQANSNQQLDVVTDKYTQESREDQKDRVSCAQNKKSIVVKDTDGTEQVFASMNDMIDTERKQIQSTERSKQPQKPSSSKQVLDSHDTMKNLATMGGDEASAERISIPKITKKITQMTAGNVTEREPDSEIRRETIQLEVREDLDDAEITTKTQDTNGQQCFTFTDDQPVNYTGQIDMMHDIFKQISAQRAISTRTTVRNQKIVFQPTVREFRKLDLKPVTIDDRRYPPTQADGMQPQPRPKSQTKAPRRIMSTRNSRKRVSYEATSDHFSPNQPAQADILKLNKTQLGKQGTFANLLKAKRAEKMVTWDVEPPKMVHMRQNLRSGSQSYRGNNTQSVTQNSSYGTEGYSYYYEQIPYEAQYDGTLQGAQMVDYAQQQQYQQQAQDYQDQHQLLEGSSAADMQMMGTNKSHHQMSAIHEVSSVSRHEEDRTTHTHGSKLGSEYPQLQPGLIQQMHTMLLEKSNKSQDQSNKTGVSKKDEKPPHRCGVPVGAEVDSNEGSSEEFALPDDTMQGLFYDKGDAAAFKKGDKAGHDTTDHEPDTIEWSQRMSKPPQKRDEYGNALTHKGNVIQRGFNIDKQRKMRVGSTKDPRLLQNKNLREIFDEDKHKIANYMNKLGPPTKKTYELSKQQWRRIQKAKGSYETIQEKWKVPKQAKKTKKSAKGEIEQDSKAGEEKKEEEERKPMIEGDLFSFQNPDRYRTDQLKEQAMALLVPGYLQYVYDIN